MIVFPYNDMFSCQNQNSKFKKCYFVKLNNDRIEFTDFPYWKKDILEQAPLKYANYVNANHQNQLSVFLKSTFKDSTTISFLEKRLTPSKINSSDWLFWYAKFSGNNLNRGDSLSLVEYSISNTKELPMLTDSFTICRSTIK